MEDDRRFIEAARLDRIENKLDRLTDHVSKVARIDERVITLESSCKEIANRVSSNEMKTNEIFIKVQGASRLVWIVITALCTFLVAYYFKT